MNCGAPSHLTDGVERFFEAKSNSGARQRDFDAISVVSNNSARLHCSELRKPCGCSALCIEFESTAQHCDSCDSATVKHHEPCRSFCALLTSDPHTMHRYRISKTIGDGTYGSVLLATDYTGTQVAIKKMKKKYRSFRECMELKEITSLMQLSHVNIVQMHEVLRDHSGDLYFSFEFADCNLYQFTKQHIQGTQSGGGGNGGNQGVIQHKAGKLLSPLLVRNLMYSVMQGLAFMHRHDYFHRDMKRQFCVVKAVFVCLLALCLRIESRCDGAC